MEVQLLTLFQLGGADYAHHITACPPGLEYLSAYLYSVMLLAGGKGRPEFGVSVNPILPWGIMPTWIC